MKTLFKTLAVLLGSLASLCVVGQSNVQAASVYYSATDFLAAVQASGGPYGLNDFSTMWDPAPPYPLPYTNVQGSVTLSYQISADPGGLWYVAPGGNTAVQPYNAADDLTITFTSGNVNAVGGTFFLTDGSGQPISGDLRVSLSDGTHVDMPVGGGNFAGFINFDQTAIDSLTLHVVSPVGSYVTLDDLYVATAVPEPGIWSLAMLGAAAAWLFRRRPSGRASGASESAVHRRPPAGPPMNNCG